MGQEQGLGMSRLNGLDVIRVDRIVTGTEALIDDKMLIRHLSRNVMAQVLIGRKEDVLLGQLLHDLDGIGRRDADVGRRLDRCRRIDVTDDGQIVVLGAGLFDRRRVGHVGHRTGRRRIGHEDLLLRIEHLGALNHKIDASKDDDFGIRFDSLLGQTKRIADEVSIGLDLIGHIIMSEDNGLFSFFKAAISSSIYTGFHPFRETGPPVGQVPFIPAEYKAGDPFIYLIIRY